MGSGKNESIQGDLSVSRNATIGGNMNVRGHSVFDHNVIVKGWLDAPNVKDANKGLFASAEALRAAYPLPQDGWWALVGDSVPADVWRAEDGAWVRTGGQGGTPSIDVSQFVAAALAAVDGATARFSATVDGGEVVRQTSTTAGGEVVFVQESGVFAYRLDGVLYSDWEVEGVASADLFMDDARTEMKRDKLYVCGETAYMVSAEGRLLALAHYSEIAELLLRLQGTSAESSAETDPFVSLGVFTGEDVWRQVQTALDGLVVTEEAETHRWAGLCRLSVDGARVEVVNFPLDYASESLVQVMTGCVASADGVTLARGDWQQLVRSHTAQGGWTRWQAAVQGRTDFAGLNAIADAEDYASAGNAACDVRSWAVTAPHGGREVTVGRLWQLSDAMGHQLTQVLLTHHEPGEDGSFGGHTDGKVHLWKRSYGLLQGSADCAPIGAWTAWTDLLAVPVVTRDAAGLASPEMFTRILQAEVYKYSGVAGDGDAHYSQLGGKLTAWCGETQPILRQYETNNGANGDYRQGVCLMWRSMGDTARFAACFEGADRSALTGRAFLLRFDNTDGAWAYKGYIDLSGQSGDEYLSEWIATVQEQAVAAQPAVFDGFTLMAASAEMTGTVNPESIVFDSASGRFLALKGGKYYTQWTYTNGETARQQPGAYAGAGKTFLRSSGGLYVLTEAGELTDVTSEMATQLAELTSRVEVLERAVDELTKNAGN